MFRPKQSNKQNPTKGNGVTFRIFPKYGKTIATLKGADYNAINILNRIVNKAQDSFWWEPSSKCPDMLLSSSYTGISKTNFEDGDSFNEEYGKELARTRAMEKYHKDLDPILRAYLYDARKLVASIERYMNNHNIDYSGVKSIAEIKVEHYGVYDEMF